ncbi:hypothetical protein B7P43_G09359 [Cryptotermes secundus]|uniref:Uncharacterized protein n=1 Tax=Cryptotermes secundus TaxID=105785 RepID=A0A2J7RNN4_9NEOP|nr:hypothetical protein B7P43_G09359 [Cryptotermes secundus]
MDKQMESQGKLIKVHTNNFHPPKRHFPPTVQISRINIQPKEQVTYLGLTFDNKLNWRQHIIK